MTSWLEPVIVKTWADIITKHSSWPINYFLVSFFWNHYKKYLTKSILIQWESEYEAKKQLIENIWTSPSKALSLLESEAELDFSNMAWVLSKIPDKIIDNPQWNIDPDKMKRLKDLSKEYSSDEMQEYIAKILAWEYNKSWTYSLQTMDIIKTLSREEIEIFQKFKSIIFDDDCLPELIFRDTELMDKFWVNYNELLLLSSLNLVVINSSIRWLPDVWQKVEFPLRYNWKLFGLICEWKKTINSLYFLTRAWKELHSLLDNNYNEAFVDYLEEFYKSKWVELVKK